jgi:hypothetical protein
VSRHAFDHGLKGGWAGGRVQGWKEWVQGGGVQGMGARGEYRFMKLMKFIKGKISIVFYLTMFCF